jgi:hypothetical protein
LTDLLLVLIVAFCEPPRRCTKRVLDCALPAYGVSRETATKIVQSCIDKEIQREGEKK